MFHKDRPHAKCMAHRGSQTVGASAKHGLRQTEMDQSPRRCKKAAEHEQGGEGEVVRGTYQCRRVFRLTQNGV